MPQVAHWLVNVYIQDVKFCIFTVTRDIYPCSKYYHVIVYGGKIAVASKQAHRIAELQRAYNGIFTSRE
jgi:hypothetical protein